MEYRRNIKDNNNLINLAECKKKIYDRSMSLGKGGQGSAYKIESPTCGGAVLKIYHKHTTEKEIYREINILDRVKKIIDDDICPNFIYHYDFFKTNNSSSYSDSNININILLEYADGDLERWVREKHSDIEWLSLLFQFIAGVHVIQKYLKGYHSDLKPKNIFFMRTNKNENEYLEYVINTKSYYLPNTGYLFLLADYGQFNSLFLDNNNLTQEEIQDAIRDNKDFKHMKEFFKRIQVNNLLKKYSIKYINNKFKDNKNYKEHYEKESGDINETFKKFPDHVRLVFLNKNLLYYLLEKNLIDYEDEVKNGLTQEQIPPSYKIKELLESVLSEKENIDKLFEKYFDNFTNKTEKMKIIKKFNLNA